MVAPSKIFQPPLNCNHCSQSILHPNIGCLQYFLFGFHQHVISSMKYFLPLLISPLVTKCNTMNRDLFMKTLIFYLQAVGWCSICCSFIYGYVCLLRNILGGFYTYTTFFIPSVLGMQFSWLFPSKLLNLFATATSQATLESILHRYSNKLTRLILHSNVVQTILFMLNSAIILHYKRKDIYKDYWFIQPYERVFPPKNREQQSSLSNKENQHEQNEQREQHEQSSSTKCSHQNSNCTKFILEGIKSYFGYGIALDLLSMIMKKKLPQSATQGFMRQWFERLKKFRPNMTGFFISYVGIYRLSSCLLRKYYSHLSSDLQHLLSAFIGGCSFLCVGRVNILTLSMVIAAQLLWQKICNGIQVTEKNKKRNMVLWLLKNVRFAPIFFSCNIGYLVHNYVINHHLVNSLARNFIDGVNYNKTKRIHSMLVNNDLQTLMDMKSRTKIKMFF
ncbi:hypothetical protein DOY81_002662 [Sarcophaga bullata]|nr:hypothetical protein DOY81_002662 [Sarcophaga bullata]